MSVIKPTEKILADGFDSIVITTSNNEINAVISNSEVLFHGTNNKIFYCRKEPVFELKEIVDIHGEKKEKAFYFENK